MADDRLPTIAADTYVIEGEVARGGLGRVLRARHLAMGRTVAVKELLPGVAAEARFVQEALVTGRLEHPAIIPVYDAGRWPSGEPFYTMKLVSGRSLLAVIKATKSFDERLALLPNVISVVEAIAYAHSKRIIHRDIKPANVIIGSFGETVVIDWGAAKDLEAAAADGESVVGQRPAGGGGSIVGTPAYMAPEQARGGVVDERTDVYALGALIYHLLAGVSPYSAGAVGSDSKAPTRLMADPDDEATELLNEVALNPAPPLETRQTGIPLELLTIVHKAMARDPAARYPTAKELADDLKRFQTGKLVSAHHYTTWQLVRRFVSRNRAVVAVVAAAVLLLTIGGAASVARIMKARRLADEARVRSETREKELLLLQASATVDTDPTAALAWLKQYPLDGPRWDEARRIASKAYGRGVARDLLRGHKGTVRALAFSPDGKTLASGGVDGTIRLWDLASHTATRVLRRHNGIVTDVAFAPDGKTLASSGFDHHVYLWDLATASARELGQHDDGVRAIAFAPDGKTLATAGFNHRLIIWSLAGEKLRDLEGHLDSPLIVDFSPDGKTLFSAAPDDTIRLWDLETGKARILPTRSWAAFSPDGKTVAAGFDGEVRFSDLASGAVRSVRTPGLARPFSFSPDSKTVVATTIDTVRLIDVASGRMRLLSGHQSDIYDADFSPDGRLLATAGLDGTIRVWQLPAVEGQVLHGLDSGVDLVAFSPDGAQIAGAGANGIAVWDTATPGPPRLLEGDGVKATRNLMYAPDGRTLITAGHDRTLRVWDLATGAARALTTTTFLPRVLAVSRDAPSLALADGFESLRVLSYADGQERCRIEGKNIVVAVFAPGGHQLYYGNGEELRRLELETCKQTTLAATAGGWITDLSLGDRWMGYTTKYGKFGVIDVTSGALRRFADDAYESKSVNLTPDGRLMAAGSDLKITVWDTVKGVQLRELSGHDSPIEWVAFSPDGAKLMSRSADEIRIWRVIGEGDKVYRGHDARIKMAAVSPDGKTVASASADGTVRLWPTVVESGLPTEPEKLRAWLDVATSARLDEQDRISSTAP